MIYGNDISTNLLLFYLIVAIGLLILAILVYPSLRERSKSRK